MNFFMGKKFVGPGGKSGKDGPEVVIDNGAESNKKMKRMLRPVKFIIILVLVAVAALDSFYTLSENEMAVVTTFGRPSSVMTSGPKFKYPFIQKVYKMSKEIRACPLATTRITVPRQAERRSLTAISMRPAGWMTGRAGRKTRYPFLLNQR